MVATIAGYLAALDLMVQQRFVYDNRVPWRCVIGWHGRDCSTFCNFGLANAGYPNIGLCNNSFANKQLCLEAVRPDWFIEKFGAGQGTLITKEQAETVVCWGFEDTGGGHQETILGRGAESVGAHSHASGIGYDSNGINNHNLQSFAVPTQFLAEMALTLTPPDPKVLAALAALASWEARVTAKPLRFGDRGPDVATMIDLLRAHHFVSQVVTGDAYGKVARTAIFKFKKSVAIGNTDGKTFGGTAAATLLHL